MTHRTDLAARWWRDFGAVALIVVLTILFYWRYLTPDELDRVYFPQGDFTETFYVYRSLAFQELRAGRLPRWIPCVFSGYPFQADPQSSVFYPPSLLNLAAFLGMGWGHFPLGALELEAVVHVLLAGLFTYAFLRLSLQRRLAALLGAGVFAFGGYLTSYPPLQLAILESAIWLPLALLGVLLWHRSGCWLYGLLTALAFAMSILAGHPQTYMQVIYTTLAFGLYLAWRDRGTTPLLVWPLASSRASVKGERARWWRAALIRLAGPLVLALALSAVQLVPSLEYARLSTRTELPFAKAGTGFPLEDIVQFVLTGLVSHWQPLYVGILPLGLAVFALWVRRQRDTGFWLGLAVVALALSFGANTVAFDVAFLGLPGYDLFRSQERHAFLVSFALSVLAAYGAEALFGPLPTRVRAWVMSWRRLMGWSIPALLGLLIVVVFLARYGIDPSDSQALPRHVAALWLWVAGTAAVLQLRLAWPRRRLSAAGAALVLVVLDLFTLNRPINYTPRYDLYPVTPVLEPILADKGRFRIQDDYRLRGHTACMHGLEEVWGIAPIRLAHYDTFMRRAPEDVRWRLLGVRYVVTWRRELHPRPGQPATASQLIFQQGEGKDTDYVHRLPGDQPWVWVVRDVQVAQDEDDLYRRLGDPNFDPYRTAVLWEPVDVGPDEAQDRVEIVAREPTRLVIDAELGAPGLVVISEITYPGWQASVDGRPARIYEADGVLRAVRVPAGSHRIEMRFDPLSFKLGAAISALGVAGLLGLFVVGLRGAWG